MPRREYPRSRRIWMQATLCFIFAGSVALAQLVVVHHRGGVETDDRDNTSFGPVERMIPPAGWTQKSHGKSRSFLIYQEPEKPGKEPRTLRYRWEQLAEVVPVQTYLHDTEVAGRNVDVVVFDQHLDEEFPLEDGTGVLMATSRTVGTQTRVRWIACTIRPDGKAVTLELDCPTSGDPPTDKQTLLDTAESMEFRN